jgi:uncharacterized protein YbaP (TraB family)
LPAGVAGGIKRGGVLNVTPLQAGDVLRKANVPEHSVSFMEAMSGGKAFLSGPYLFLAAEDWLVAIGYPLDGSDASPAFEKELARAIEQTGARKCWAACPQLPDRLKEHLRQRDCYYVLPLDTALPARLERMAEKAAASLRVEEAKDFTVEHRRLWAEFIQRDLPPNVLELYARTESVLAQTPGLSLLNAWDANGHLAAALLIDSAPHRFATYLLGAHSRVHYTAHASDLLFREMVRRAREQGKEFIHLGLGVNDGIRRFKMKWGGRPGTGYEMAEWREKETGGAALDSLVRAMTSSPSTERAGIDRGPEQRRFAMLWELEKNGKRSWIGGTAHFFKYSFENSFRKLFSGADTIIFEGPLDPASMEQVAAAGRDLPPGSPALFHVLTEHEIRDLERVVCGPRGFWARFLDLEWPNAPDVRHLLAHTRPWMAFFSLWSAYLTRKGWTGSVDLEAWRLAREMGKRVRTMETIPEQIEALGDMPIARIANYLRKCREWDSHIKRNIRTYLKGDLQTTLGSNAEFPTRVERVIDRRDAVFLERMRPFIEEGRTIVFVGTAHMVNLRGMLAGAGFSVKKAQ